MTKRDSTRSVVVRLLFRTTATAFLMACAYCLLWVASSADLAFLVCDGKYDLFAANPRCRQPVVAGLLALVFLSGAICAWVAGGRRWSARAGQQASSACDSGAPEKDIHDDENGR